MKAEINQSILDLKKRVALLVERLALAEKKKEIADLEEQTTKKDFWADKEKAEKLMKKLGGLKEEVKEIGKIKEKLISSEELLSLAREEKAQDLEFVEKELKEIKKSLEKMELRIFLAGLYDPNDAILSVHAGQGGTEACDWAAMLQRMYFRFAERKGWKVQMVEERAGEEAGIKSVTLFIRGRFAYGLLKKEKGTHRLVRLSPFNAKALRQTSFAQVEVMPIFEEESEEIKLNPKDLQIGFSRASGHGGQNVNKVSTAVRIKHIPTGVVVEAQTQRYQEQNRKIAMQILQGKLWQLQQQEREKKEKEIKGEYKIAGWGHQIRSYVLHPYKLVKDLRTGWEEKNPQAVLDGELDGFIQAEVKGL